MASLFGGSGADSQTNTTAPDWLLNYQQENFQIADQLADQPYTAYTGPRLAQQNDFQTAAITNVVNGMVDPFRSNLMNSAATGLQAAQNFQAPMIGGIPQVYGTSYNPTSAQAAMTGPMQGYTAQQAATAQAALPAAMQAARMQAATMQGATPSVAARTVSRAGTGDVAAERVNARMFPSFDINQYINPFTQAALNPALTEIGRQGQIQRNQNQARAAAAGAYGGSRHGVLDAEQQRNTAQLLADTETQGMYGAFDRATGLITNDANRDLTGQMANQGAALQAGIANQGNARALNIADTQFGSQADALNAQMAFERMRTESGYDQAARLANAGWEQGANQQNYQGGLQLGMFNAGEANRVGIANAGFGNEASRFTAGEQNRGTLQNSVNQQQTNLANADAYNLANRFGATQAQAAATTNAANWMTGATNNQDASLQAAQLGLNASLGMDDLALQDQALAQNDFRTLFGIGNYEQQQNQANLDLAYQDFLRQQGYPAQMLQLRMAPLGQGSMPSQTTTSTSGGGGTGVDLLGLSLYGAGLANRMGWI